MSNFNRTLMVNGKMNIVDILRMYYILNNEMDGLLRTMNISDLGFYLDLKATNHKVVLNH